MYSVAKLPKISREVISREMRGKSNTFLVRGELIICQRDPFGMMREYPLSAAGKTVSTIGKKLGEDMILFDHISKQYVLKVDGVLYTVRLPNLVSASANKVVRHELNYAKLSEQLVIIGPSAPEVSLLRR